MRGDSLRSACAARCVAGVRRRSPPPPTPARGGTPPLRLCLGTARGTCPAALGTCLFCGSVKGCVVMKSLCKLASARGYKSSKENIRPG